MELIYLYIEEPKLLVKQKSFFVITKLQKAVDSIRSDEKSKLFCLTSSLG